MLLINWLRFSLHCSYQIYYSQATANPRHGSELKMVNWWSSLDGLVRFPLLPPPKRVYTNFENRRFVVPVLHVRINWWTWLDYNRNNVKYFKPSPLKMSPTHHELLPRYQIHWSHVKSIKYKWTKITGYLKKKSTFNNQTSLRSRIVV